MKKIQQILMALIFTVLTVPLLASDLAKEKRWANQVIDFLVDGEPHWLTADGQQFLSIYTPAATDSAYGAVILLHGRGVHPDWPQVIQPLRTQLPAKGWTTLSLQMPVLPNEADYKEYAPLFAEVPARIKAGVEFLVDQNYENISLIGHSLGTNMATHFLATHPESGIKAFVGIGMWGIPQPAQYQVFDNVAAMLQLRIPILDIYGSHSDKEILESVDRRAFAVYQRGDGGSRQIKFQGSNHYYEGHEQKLVDVIDNWLFTATKPVQINKFVVRE